MLPTRFDHREHIWCLGSIQPLRQWFRDPSQARTPTFEEMSLRPVLFGNHLGCKGSVSGEECRSGFIRNSNCGAHRLMRRILRLWYVVSGQIAFGGRNDICLISRRIILLLRQSLFSPPQRLSALPNIIWRWTKPLRGRQVSDFLKVIWTLTSA